MGRPRGRPRTQGGDYPGEKIVALRERLILTQKELADALNAALGRSYTADSVRRWEKGDRGVSLEVEAFLEQLEVARDVDAVVDAQQAAAAAEDQPLEAPESPADTAPPGVGAPDGQKALTSSGGLYATACRELWEMVAMAVGTMGTISGSPALELDGQIILADAPALGEAWGKLAETNDTFRKFLVGATEGGVWLQLALVTGTTMSKCWQGHGYYAAEQQRLAQTSPNGHVERVDDELAPAA